MRFSIITPGTFDPVPLSLLQLHLRMNTSDEDETLLQYLRAAVSVMESFTRRQLSQATVEAYYDYHWHRYFLPASPLGSVNSVTFVDSTGTTQTLDPSLYTTDTTTTPGSIHIHQFPVPLSHHAEPLVTVNFLGGYSSPEAIPSPLKQAILLLASSWYDARSTITMGTTPTFELPYGFKLLAQMYRVYEPFGFQR